MQNRNFHRSRSINNRLSGVGADDDAPQVRKSAASEANHFQAGVFCIQSKVGQEKIYVVAFSENIDCPLIGFGRERVMSFSLDEEFVHQRQ